MTGIQPKPKDRRFRFIGGGQPRMLMSGEQSFNADTEDLVTMFSNKLAAVSGSFMPLSGGTFTGNLTMGDSNNIVFGTTTGTQIGTSSSQKIGFYGATPVIRPATISDPSGGGTQDAEARSAINDLIDRLQTLGLIT